MTRSIITRERRLIENMTAFAADIKQFLSTEQLASSILRMRNRFVSMKTSDGLPCQFRRFALEIGRRLLLRDCTWGKSCLIEGAVAENQEKMCQPAHSNAKVNGSKHKGHALETRIRCNCSPVVETANRFATLGQETKRKKHFVPRQATMTE